MRADAERPTEPRRDSAVILKTSADKESVRAAWFSKEDLPKLRVRDDEVIEWIAVAEKLQGCPLPLLTLENRCYPPR
ncbi:MAG: hypothetical protein KA354_24690 [Phycisphaerae bacterium]|nr:hypothetical protein [Phycisphaerae bacterium]